MLELCYVKKNATGRKNMNDSTNMIVYGTFLTKIPALWTMLVFAFGLRTFGHGLSHKNPIKKLSKNRVTRRLYAICHVLYGFGVHKRFLRPLKVASINVINCWSDRIAWPRFIAWLGFQGGAISGAIYISRLISQPPAVRLPLTIHRWARWNHFSQ